MSGRDQPLAGLAHLAAVIERVERAISVLLLCALFGVMSAQVIARYVLGRPIAWSEELARFALIWLTFVAAAFVMAGGRHIAVDVVSRPMGRRGRVALECVSSTVVLAVCAALVPAGIAFVRQTGSILSPALEMPMAWWYFAPVLGFALLGLHAGINLVLTIGRGRPVWDRADGDTVDPGVLT